MSVRILALAIFAALTLGLPVAEASAAGRKTASLAPLGFQIFCLQHPKECKRSSNSKAAHSSILMRTLKRVNVSINRRIKPSNDRQGTDKWSLGVSTGDCEDYVLAKRSALIRAGIAPGALRIATARTRQGEGHAVLIVKTSKGDLVLDNRTNSIKSKPASRLRFIAISGANPMRWAAL